MPYANSQYGNGVGTLNAQPYAAHTDITNMADLLKGYKPPPVFQEPQMAAKTQRAAMAQPQPQEGVDQNRRALEKEQLRALQIQNRDAQARADAKSMTAPTKQLTGFNMQGTVMEDPEKLTGYQREVFLPQSAVISEERKKGEGDKQNNGQVAQPQEEDSGYKMRQATLGEALRSSNEDYNARQQREAMQGRGMQMPSSAYGR